jgi:SNF2 family DNA or RNA helicase
MPEKTYEDREVELDPKQRRTYDAMAEDMLTWVGEHEDQPLAAPAVISQLVRLQQFAVAYGKMDVKYKDGQAYRYLVLDEPSSKLDAAMDIIGATNAQVVVFGQSKQALNLLAARLVAAGISVRMLTGDVSQKDRDQSIEEFQAGHIRVFCCSIKAGGVGVTLTAATVEIFLDRAWSPTANRQAEDRCHRLGQKNAVLIIILVARNTIDPARNAKIELKWSWVKQILENRKEDVNAV